MDSLECLANFIAFKVVAGCFLVPIVLPFIGLMELGEHLGAPALAMFGKVVGILVFLAYLVVASCFAERATIRRVYAEQDFTEAARAAWRDVWGGA
jgi:hypothetical protein